ncbi:MAG: lipase family protein [Candidatus Heimdallarchaeota archaeon]
MKNFEISKRYYNYYNTAFGKTKNVNYTYIIKKNDVMAICENFDKDVFIFKGTDDVKDWINNIKYKPETEEWDFHKGFKLSGDRFYNNIKKIIFNKKIIFIGYSRGGAIALYLADKLAEEYKHLSVECYTYGQPRVFSGNKCNEIETSFKNILYFRTYFQHDIVTKLPLKLTGYKHLKGKNVVLKSKWWHWLPFLSMKIAVHLQYDNVL